MDDNDVFNWFNSFIYNADTKEKAINDYVTGKITKEQLDIRMKKFENH